MHVRPDEGMSTRCGPRGSAVLLLVLAALCFSAAASADSPAGVTESEAKTVFQATFTAGAPTRTLGTLELHATFKDAFYEEACPPGPVPVQVECFAFAGRGVVTGLGKATVTWHLVDDLADGLSCQHFYFTTIVVKVAGKGEIDASLTDPKTHCWTRPPVVAGPFVGTVVGGSGSYAGASGTLQVTENLKDDVGGAGDAIETWVGTLTVPGLDFDLTPPTLHGVHDIIVRARKAKRVRVRFTVTAADAARAVPVTCAPRSGSLFKRGRTTVTCSATDKNGNTSNATFAVIVKR
jgi:HYR domain-containing protein